MRYLITYCIISSVFNNKPTWYTEVVDAWKFDEWFKEVKDEFIEEEGDQCYITLFEKVGE